MNTPLLLPVNLLTRRNAVSHGSAFASLADGLAVELEPLFNCALPIPHQKARLSRTGGRCPRHGVLLEFDPCKPHDHRCWICGENYRGKDHDDWWAMNAQLWTVERAVHAAAIFLLRDDARYAELAERILVQLSRQYLTWPNADNVLGPSRPFFSTYLESIWILNVCHALALLEQGGREKIGSDVRERLIAPSSELIAGFPEGKSNRQVWNEIAILSAWTLLGRNSEIDERLASDDSLPTLLERGLLDDGSWYEGENYHLFAHRGLWYGVQWFKANGRALPAELLSRFDRGFLAPFSGVLPDLTLPSRRDSPYAVSVRQWRIAEYCELGYVRTQDERLAGLLRLLYDESYQCNPNVSKVMARGRSVSTADAERPELAGSLSRADLSWRALLFADPKPIPAADFSLPSINLESQGLSVIRRERGRVYVALEGGHTGGGHGHPDRLALTFQTGRDRWLDDPGTGSYTDPRLHWFRSTLAHYAPLINRSSQIPRVAQLLAFEDRGGAGWIRKRVLGAAPGVTLTRTVVVCDGYLVDLLEWNGPAGTCVTLPVCGEVSRMSGLDWIQCERIGAGGLEDGFDFLTDIELAVRGGQPNFEAGYVIGWDGRPHAALGGALSADAPDFVASAWYASSLPMQMLRANAPTQQLRMRSRRHWLEVQGNEGVIAGVWSWSHAGDESLPVSQVSFPSLKRGCLTKTAEVQETRTPGEMQRKELVVVCTRDGTESSHELTADGWHIGFKAGAATSSIDFALLEQESHGADSGGYERERRLGVSLEQALAVGHLHVPVVPTSTLPSLDDQPAQSVSVTLGRTNYRQTEVPWGGDHCPRAAIEFFCTPDYTLVARISVEMGEGREFASPRLAAGMPDAMPENCLDNERSDINVCGVQWYFTRGAQVWTAAGLTVPLANDHCAETAKHIYESGQPKESHLYRNTSLLPGREGTTMQESSSALSAYVWRLNEQGWLMQLAWPRETWYSSTAEAGIQLVINEAVAGRERRLGQLVLACWPQAGGDGAGGKKGIPRFAFLCGDREDPRVFVRLSPMHFPG